MMGRQSSKTIISNWMARIETNKRGAGLQTNKFASVRIAALLVGIKNLGGNLEDGPILCSRLGFGKDGGIL